MDVLLIQSSVLQLPSSRRVDAVVHDGTTDLRLWPGPGADRELLDAYGDDLPKVLERERAEHGVITVGEMVRLHRGKLHCDYLLWVATRLPEEKGIQAPAPNETTLREAVLGALRFSADRHVKRIAFGLLGAGPNALDETDRLVILARASNAYYDECFQAGKPSGIEEVLICHASSSRIAAARRLLGKTVSAVQELPKRDDEKEKKPRTSTRPDKPRATRKSAAPKLDELEIGKARASAGPYDRARTYAVGDWFVHSKFGVGRVQELTPEGFIAVLFEGGDIRRLLHSRP
jgi:O-acetyl-ADP-ribose deacetylase (regulator of RNase III)